MRLSDLLAYDDIVIQCHDNPDADALASGFALSKYLLSKGKTSRFIYRGRNKISKSNLLIMIRSLNIPISYEPDYEGRIPILVNVDCQYGQRNVSAGSAETVAIIDHHKAYPLAEGVDPELTLIRSNIGSCSTVIWDMMRDEGIDANDDPALATALYYGLYTDTNKLSEMNHPLDRDMVDSLTNTNMALIREMSNSNISLEELKITGDAILGYQYLDVQKTLLIEADPCDPNILGVISDFALETDKVDVTVAFYHKDEEIKFSVRSCSKTVHANDLAGFIAEGAGGAGGHMFKAGGMMLPDKINTDVNSYITARISAYFEQYDILYAKDTVLDTSTMRCYTKLDQELGTVKLTDVFPEKSKVLLRTLEGDINIIVDNETYLMIGIEGEVYPIKESKLRSSYRFIDAEYHATFEYEPSIKNLLTGENKKILEYARPVMSSGGTKIYAAPLKRAVKLFTAWDEERYYLGNIGDYIAVREDDCHDIYVVNRKLFDKLYKEC